MKLEKVWIGSFITLWVLVSTISTIHSVSFFELSNNKTMSWVLALSFEIGAIASLGGLLISSGKKTLIWMLFVILTLFQIHSNMYWAWVNAGNITTWEQMLSLSDEDEMMRKRIFVIISGGILPLISLGFIKSLMDYMKPKPKVTEDASIEEKPKRSFKNSKIADILKNN